MLSDYLLKNPSKKVNIISLPYKSEREILVILKQIVEYVSICLYMYTQIYVYIYILIYLCFQPEAEAGLFIYNSQG